MGIKLLLLAVSVGALFAFQNCGKAGFDSVPGSSNLSSSSVVDSKIAAAPFPYKVTPNLISFMNCPMASMTSNPDEIYSFKVMGVSTLGINARAAAAVGNFPQMASGGVALSADFVNYMRSKFKGAQKDVTADQIMSVLQNSKSVASLRPQVGLRNATQQDWLTGQNWSIAVGGTKVASWALSGSLDNPKIAKLLADAALTSTGTMLPGEEVYVSSFPGAGQQTSISGAIGFGAGDRYDRVIMGSYANALRADSGQYRLALAYVANSTSQASTSGQNTKGIPIVADVAGSGIHGLGYRFNFGPAVNPTTISSVNPSGSSAGANNIIKAVISSVQEMDLETDTPTNSNWDCFHLAIVRFKDRGLCPNGKADLSSDVDRLKHELVRKALPANIWDVNIKLGCIVPTESATSIETSCYATTDGNAENQTLNNGDTVYSPERQNWYPFVGNKILGNDWTGKRLVINQGASSEYNKGIEYRYWSGNECSNTSPQRECVHFASFCYKKRAQ